MSSTLSYEQVCAEHSWDVPERYNIAADVCDRHPRDKPAMIHEDFDGNVRRLDWGELQDSANRFANVLVAHGVQRGDRVAMLLPPTPETAAAFFGTWKVGAILLSMSVLYGDEGIRHRLTDSQPKVLVTNQANADRMERSLVEHVLILDDALLGTGSDTVRRPSTPPPTTRRSSTTRRARRAWPRASCMPIATSSPTRSSSTATTCRTGELFHGMGEWAWAAGIAPAAGALALRRGPVRLPARGRLRPRQAAGLPLPPRGHQRVRDADGDPLDDVDHRRRHPLPAEVPDRVLGRGAAEPRGDPWVREQYGITVLDFYGLTESYPLCANFPFMEVREGSMGKPMPGWDVAILDEDERPVAAGERGEICLRARSNPHYPLGYWNRPQEDSDEVFGGEWFHTKDAASTDEDGYYWYEGRADDVIISAGYRIGPFEVESACLEHPAVAEAAAVAVPDERRGNVVKAFVVLSAGHDPSDSLADEIKAFVRDHLSAYAYPRLIEFVPDLPKTLTGKIRRIELRQREAQDRAS